MISAQADTLVQEQLIEKYMLLPNQVWDDIISQASKVCSCVKHNKIDALYLYIMQLYFNINLLPECRCLKGPRSRETTRQHLKNKC